MIKKLPLMLSIINAIVNDTKLELDWDALGKKFLILIIFFSHIIFYLQMTLTLKKEKKFLMNLK